ncbi:hypothetical protein QR680_002492 [Steinernema hermaphroditum]|uniref:Uncharacterized protein n=1 Tax=Steinernema hermaphroditum TaxID=289476 RepID=A0AA39LID3_9BILA|nr:hypothetical protein QR680_002492 [Steinernema hermaphroditum]
MDSDELQRYAKRCRSAEKETVGLGSPPAKVKRPTAVNEANAPSSRIPVLIRKRTVNLATTAREPPRPHAALYVKIGAGGLSKIPILKYELDAGSSNCRAQGKYHAVRSSSCTRIPILIRTRRRGFSAAPVLKSAQSEPSSSLNRERKEKGLCSTTTSNTPRFTHRGISRLLKEADLPPSPTMHAETNAFLPTNAFYGGQTSTLRRHWNTKRNAPQQENEAGQK